VPRIAYQANYVPEGRMVRAIWLPTQIALAVLLTLILVGVPAVVSVGAFLLSLYLAIRASLYRAEFVMDDDGISESLTPLSVRWTWRRPVTRRFRWDQVVDWSLDDELTRGYQMRKRLVIRFRDPAHSVRLDEVGDGDQRAAYAAFVNGFLVRAAGEPLPALSQLPARVPVEVVRERAPWPERPGALPRRRAFFSTVAGRLTGLVLLGGVVAVSVLLLSLGGSFSSWYRLVFVLVPGALYLAWRLFLRR